MNQQKRCNQPTPCLKKPRSTIVWLRCSQQECVTLNFTKVPIKLRCLSVTLSHEALSLSETASAGSDWDAQQEAIKLPAKGLLIDMIVSSVLNDNCTMSKMAGCAEFVCNCFRIRLFFDQMKIDFCREKMEKFLPQRYGWTSFHEMKQAPEYAFFSRASFLVSKGPIKKGFWKLNQLSDIGIAQSRRNFPTVGSNTFVIEHSIYVNPHRLQ